MRLKAFDTDAANSLLAEMRREAEDVVQPAAREAEIETRRVAFMRYVGQGHEITVDLPDGDFGEGTRRTIQDAFDREYARYFRRTLPNAEVEVLTWAVALSTKTALPFPSGTATDSTAPIASGTRPLYDPQSGEMEDVPVFRRVDLAPGARLKGPGLIVEDATSTYVPGGFSVDVAANGYIVLNRGEAGKS